MTKEETKQRIAVMQAYVDGKQVQVYDISLSKWFDTDAPSWITSRQFRIYSTSDRPFLQIVDRKGETFLRIRQATEQGYTDCPCPGAADLSYPSSALRRSRTVGGGKLVNALTAASGGVCVFVEL